MPKIREHRHVQKALVVSPWQSRREAGQPAPGQQAPEACASSADTPQLMYSVVTSEALLASGAAPSQPSTAAAVAAAVHAQPALPLSQAEGSSSGWHTRPKQQAAMPSLASCQTSQQGQLGQGAAATAPQQLPHGSGSTDEMSADETAQDADTDDEQQQQQQQQQSRQRTPTPDAWLETDTPSASAQDVPSSGRPGSSSTPVLQGVAQLVLHPSGAISGHFVSLRHSNRSSSAQRLAGGSSSSDQGGGGSSSSPGLCLGLQGRQVLGIHSCYRDPEWALINLSIIRYSSSSSSSSDHTAAAAAAAAAADSGDGGVPATAVAQPGSGPGTLALSSAPPSPAPPPPTPAPPPAAAPAAAAPAAAAPAAAAPAAAAPAAAAAVQGHAQGFTTTSSSGSSQAEAVAWVQRKGGDLVTLEPADFDDEDTEAAVLADNLGELPANVTLHFTAHTLLSGPAAAQVLCKTRPELVGRPDVVVNLGEMSIAGLPVGFLGGCTA